MMTDMFYGEETKHIKTFFARGRNSKALVSNIILVDLMEKLINELKVKIVEILDLKSVQSDQIDEDDPLVGGILGIDSIDILEMVIMIEADYQVVIDNRELGQKVFVSLRTLADYIYYNSKMLSN